ncbi:type III pantothenate kinase [Oscillatoria sp. FACHB-1406]|uniref:type III pantothenate kinase n=1 Tax=Oscillatoria sp. FACHB-1406 TaxID=2692846 RepID=UPI0016840DCD|nr:type III pantothenate kinase [Oscillatoria sp. FACHB-1406]MBD2577370.1 type III pantothenate kinase [Oscillatoria sp. FACHB-1406]
MQKTDNLDWLGLAIGNSRLHWAWFQGQTLLETHNSEHFSPENPSQFIPLRWPINIPLIMASVVSQQTVLLKKSGLWGAIAEIQLADIPLEGIYATMGIDRALSILGAAQTYGAPILVIDAGTALTFTAASPSPRLPVPQSPPHPVSPSPSHPVSPSPPHPLTPSPHPLTLLGGAILPGLRLQFQVLGQKTAALPEVQLPESLPSRWCLETEGAIASGILYTVLAGIRDFIADWRAQFPQSAIVLTGGDADWLQRQLLEIPGIIVDPYLIFWGMRGIICNS